MKLVTAIIKPFKMDDARRFIRHWRARRHGDRGQRLRATTGSYELYRGAEYVVDFLPKLKLEIAVPDEQVDAIVDSIMTSASTGKIGDGKIFVAPLEQVVQFALGRRARRQSSLALGISLFIDGAPPGRSARSPMTAVAMSLAAPGLNQIASAPAAAAPFTSLSWQSPMDDSRPSTPASSKAL